ncbi:MAG TPA: HWE histidine kinase domain-containing protein [Alphaproteobacteria bacterium]|jgi:two-component sensor histidine kinase/PAS domain-containing protein
MSPTDPPFTPFASARAAAGAPAFRVLWCDADPGRAARAKRVLAGRAIVDIATDTGAALASALGILPDLVVCAADTEGGEPAAMAALRRDSRLGAIPIMLIAAGAASAAAAARTVRVADVLAEPFADHELVARVAAQLEILRLGRALAEKETERETWLQLALKAAGLGVWHAALSSGELHMDANLAAMFGLPPEPVVLKDAEWMARVHPEDRPRLVAELAARRQDLKPLEIDFRTVLPDGSFRSLAVLGAVVRRDDDVAYRSVGVARDVTERARDAARRQVLLGELNHRVRNSLAVVLSLAQQTAQGATSLPDFLSAFQGRVMALASAHNLLTRAQWQGASLGALVEASLAPERAAKPALVEIAGPACDLPPQKALAMTMGLHELATNARKYGSLSAAGGRLSVTWTVAETGGERRLALLWLERGGPPVTTPTRSGFGSRLLQRVLSADVEGSVRLDFDPPGVRCTVEFPLDRAAE